MDNREKAKIILDALDTFIQVNWSAEGFYIKAIMKGLEEIDRKEKK